MLVLGTAGHVDHGKSTLLRRLTGEEPDRLPEEKKRGMTIDLNFVWYRDVGIIDVPGHQRFVKNMVAGVATIDAFLFVVAADDGWMPQSEEHLRVLRSLGVADGIAVITKTDLADPAPVAADLAARLPGVEIVTSADLDAVRAALDRLIARLPPARDIGRPRLWVDRVFTPKGQGLVITGTLREGSLREGDAIFVGGARATVRSLQSHGRSVKIAAPVSRVAIGVAKVEAARGMLVTTEAPFLSRRFDVKLDLFVEWSKKNREVAFHLGTHREPALVVPLDGDFARVKLRNAVPIRSEDRFLLRTPGEEHTLGAGVIVDPDPKGRVSYGNWKPGIAGLIEYHLAKSGLLDLALLAESSPYSRAELESAAKAHSVAHIGPALFLESARFSRAGSLAREQCVAHHIATGDPLGEGALVAALKMPQASRVLASLVVAGRLRKENRGYWATGYQRITDPAELKRRGAIRALLARNPMSLRELESGVPQAKRSVVAMVGEGALVSLSDEHFFAAEDYDAVKKKVRDYLATHDAATTSDLRQFLETSRKNAVLLLERMDRDRLTYLKDGVRRLLK